jgi:hypothetical protein
MEQEQIQMQQKIWAAVAAAGFTLATASLALAAQPKDDPGQYSGNGSASVPSTANAGTHAGNAASKIDNGAAWGGSGGEGAAKVDNGAAWGGSGGEGSAKVKR